MPCQAHAREVQVRVRLREETTMRLAACSVRQGIPESPLAKWANQYQHEGVAASDFTDRYAAFKHLEPDIGPLAYWLQIDTAIDQCLCQISTSSAECVRPDGNRPRNFICIKELDGLVRPSHTYAATGSLVDVPLLQEKAGITSRPGSHYIRNNLRYLTQAVRQIQSGTCPDSPISRENASSMC